MMSTHGTSSSNEGLKPELWKNFKFGTNMTHSMVQSVPGKVARTMIGKVNAAQPFSRATSVLDIACGQGLVFDTLFAQHPDLPASTSLLAVDISEPMIADLQERAKTVSADDPGHRWADARIWAADATSLAGVDDASQSHVTSQMGIFMIPGYKAALDEAYRVLAPDGVFSMSAIAWTSWNDEIMSMIEEMHPERKLPKLASVWRAEETFRTTLEASGFKDVSIEEIEVALVYETATKVVDSFWTSMPHVKGVVEDMSEEDKKACKAAMVKKIETDYPNNELPGRAMLAVARK